MKALDPGFLAPKFSRKINNISGNQFLDMLTTMKTCRPQNLKMYVEFVVESDRLVKDHNLLCVDRLFLEKHNL